MLKIIELDIDAELGADTGVWEIAFVEFPAIEQEMIYFSKQRFFKAPENVASQACRAIKENEERGNPAGTQVGKVRAQQLCNRNEISLETVKRMKSYLERAKVYNSGNWDDNGTISWHLWGGQEALDWVDRILTKEENMEMEPNPCWEGYEPYGTKIVDGVEVPNCIPVEAKKQEFVKPEAGESENDFIGRCIPVVIGEGYEQDQAAAICYSYWRDKFSSRRVGFDWEVLKTEYGRNLFEREMGYGSVPVIFVNGIPSRELIAFTNKYRIPASSINMYTNLYQKVDLIKQMGLVRHYDQNFEVRRELGNVAVNFDYDTSALPTYNSYPESGDTESMLIKPQLPPVLFSEDCGCNKKEEFNLVGFIDGQPVFSSKEEAELYGQEVMGCDGSHEHQTEDGEIVYMSCDMHPTLDPEEKALDGLLTELKKTNYQKFQEVVTGLARGFTRAEVLQGTYRNGTKFYEYALKGQGEPTRDFCMSIEGQFFRLPMIWALVDYNTDFGHNRQPYSKWIYKGGPNCAHAFREYEWRNNTLVDNGWVSGKPGMAPQEMPNQGYYSPETKRRSEIAYIISQQNMSAEVKLYDELEPVTYVDGLPLYYDPVLASDASYLLGCGGITEQVEYQGKIAFQSCSYKAKKAEVQEQTFQAIEEKRMVYTPLMIPNMLIPRLDEVTGERYFVRFKPEVIEKIQQKFMIEQRLRETNLEHTNKKFNDAVMVESWLVQGKSDKAYSLGFTEEQVPIGTWMGGYKVLETQEGDELWNKYIKKGKVRGMSVEGNFLLQFSRENSDDYLLEQIIKLLNTITE
jgi:hypothetical protein